MEPRRPTAVRTGALANRISHHLVSTLHSWGWGIGGSRRLVVRGRKSGELRRVPVNLLEHDGRHYLVGARGHVPWTHNLRAAGEGTLVLGRRISPFTAVEIEDAHKPELLRAYLERWEYQVRGFFGGVTARSTEEELRAVAADHPVFALRLSAGTRP
ncbi:deazaflavin-dependent oxidoreductase, nitroreductase family [Streptomyces zhaozhouensis]|uniref:Deazaflavin-dependent oxidoreductase, nitroreductase family n=1 Tax=Streptomyces zhaozhouensis TaxID=1300267 RepID=A0A286DP33_9ACTN|nr:nitroreductase family deazaflavin-dependent oxidoreductase [Streptomyces zhaozhouensis]SOD60458.1 deazaflavin-dependent oxidoreductase, nitroreductase family [Streptomyces zhaozhouensis]